jgi:hypothetical protein
VRTLSNFIENRCCNIREIVPRYVLCISSAFFTYPPILGIKLALILHHLHHDQHLENTWERKYISHRRISIVSHSASKTFVPRHGGIARDHVDTDHRLYYKDNYSKLSSLFGIVSIELSFLGQHSSRDRLLSQCHLREQ